MARPEWTTARSLVIGNLLAVAAVAVFSTAAQASADYRVWYFDDNFNTFNAGDVSDGFTKLVPPAWACGIVFDDPSYYRWVDSYGVNVGDGNFNFYFGQEVDDIFRAPIQLGVTFLAAEAFDLGHGNSLDADLRQRFTHVVQFEWLNNGRY